MKPWYLSKTIWFNAITMLLGIIPIVGAFVKLIEPQTAVTIDGVLAMIAGIGNVIIRVWFTDQPIFTAANMAKLTAAQAQERIARQSSYPTAQPK